MAFKRLLLDLEPPSAVKADGTLIIETQPFLQWSKISVAAIFSNPAISYTAEAGAVWKIGFGSGSGQLIHLVNISQGPAHASGPYVLGPGETLVISIAGAIPGDTIQGTVLGGEDSAPGAYFFSGNLPAAPPSSGGSGQFISPVQQGQASRIFTYTLPRPGLTVNPTPTSFTNLGNIAVTVPARSVARPALCFLDCLANPHNCIFAFGLDGSAPATLTANTPSDSDGNSSQNASWILTIPGDNKTHVISIMIAAQGSTAASTVFQALLSVIDTGP